MALRKVVVKRCEKCGTVWNVRGGLKSRCRRRAFGKGSYACWGRLVPVRPAAPGKPADRPQDVAARKRDAAQKKVDAYRREQVELAARIAKLYALQAKWTRTADRYARLAARTDAEVAAARELKRRQADERDARRATRAIRLEPAS